MRRISVTAGKGYDILISRDALAQAGEWIKSVTTAQKIAVISDSNVAPLYGNMVLNSLTQAGFQATLHQFPAGEQSKNLDAIAEMLQFLANSGLDRKDLVVALGGGVTGDMAGFAASIYLRGIAFVQLPTTLLAQIDSSVGGKTGVDLPQGKNLCGTFWQPDLVLIDPDVLTTLPPRYFADGLAEAIKYGCIKSPSLFAALEQYEISVSSAQLEDIIEECVCIKRDIVQRDERESGERMLLNFGHTLGHALEKHYQYEKLSHGEAVGIGMVMAAEAGEKLGLTTDGTAHRIRTLLQKYALPVSDGAGIDALVEALGMDKKRRGNSIRFILLSEIGASMIHPLEMQELVRLFVQP